MSFSNRRVRGIASVKRSVATTLIIGVMALPLSPVQAEGMGALARRVLDSATGLLPKTKSLGRSDARIKPKQIESPGQREAQVARVRLCPRKLLMYVGEEFRLAPLPLDNDGAPVHGVVFSWVSSDSQVATVASDGTVAAAKSGQCFVTASLAQKQARVRVEVRDGRKFFNPGGGTRETHEDQYNNTKKALDRKLLEYDRGKCNGRGGPGEGGILGTARQMHSWRVPAPLHGITHPSVSQGQQLWDNVPIMPINPYIPPIRIRIRIPIRIPVFP